MKICITAAALLFAASTPNALARLNGAKKDEVRAKTITAPLIPRKLGSGQEKTCEVQYEIAT